MATITGTSSNNNLVGTSGDDFIYGLAGDDTLDGRLGNDTLDGGDHSKSGDTVKYATAAGAVIVNLSTGTATGGAGNDTLLNIENIIGSANADTLTGDANANTLDGQGGNDVLDGGDGNDSLNGGWGSDTLYGGAGHDTLEGGGGNDILDGGTEGKGKGSGDTAKYATAASAVVVNLSTGTATGGAGIDTLISIENIAGSAFADTLTGDANSNGLNGSEGNDILYGGDGNDSLSGDSGSDTLWGGTGDDYLNDYSGITDGIADINTLDGGAGNDTFSVYSAETIDSSVLAGGTGADRFYLDPNNLSVLKITDFTVGSGGDVIDINSLIYSSIGYSSGNPFDPAQGYLCLVQSGADAQLQWDRDGAAAGDSSWQTVLTLQSINLAATPLTLENFSPRVPLDGSTAVTLTGDAGDNYLEGTLVDDTLYGLAGYDTLYGYAGNDHLEGGTDNDNLSGDLGSDTLLGGAGDDYLNDSSWTIDGIANSNTLNGGSGNDTFYVFSAETIDNSVLTGGTGADRFYLDSYNLGVLKITDFTVGSGGDVIDINNLIYNSSGYSSGNPFDPAQGYLRLVQSGADTALQWDQDGAASGAYGWQTVLTLQNINLAATPLTLENFSPRVPPDGSTTVTLTGDAGDNALEGTPFDDTIYGLAGSDTLNGYAGNDHLEGGADNDYLYGDLGDDTLLGGAGDDYLHGGEGNDILNGGAESKSGDYANYYSAIDSVIVNLSTGTATGGAGNDTLINMENIIGSAFADILIGDANSNGLNGSEGNDILYGGDGNDILSGGKGDDYLDGGIGRDRVDYSGGTVGVIVNLSAGTATDGSGNDTLINIENIIGSANADTLTGDTYSNDLYGSAGDDILSGGEGDDYLDGGTSESKYGPVTGSDTASYSTAASAVIVNLLLGTATGGAGNDSLISIENITGSPHADTLTGDANPNILDGGAGADNLKGGLGDDSYVVDSTGDVVTEKFNEGIDNVSSSVNYTLLANVENLTLTGVLTINGTGNGLANNITGNSAINNLNGGGGSDTLSGGDGNDILNGGAGADTLVGGLGDDSYAVDNANDVIIENLSEGIDKVNSSVTHTLFANVENLTLMGALAINGTGNELANFIIGNTAANQLDGGSGNDTLDGGLGSNVLTGGTGNDSFRFTTTGHVDTITDYNVINDTIRLENAVFTALTTTGTLAGNNFKIGAAADVDDFIIYNNVTGVLSYDADGNTLGGVAAVQIAKLTGGLAMTNADIVVF
jgi:Ca2+-binding RTX toxin-like protein